MKKALYAELDNLMANGCIHGHKPAKDCLIHNGKCVDGSRQLEIEKILDVAGYAIIYKFGESSTESFGSTEVFHNV